MFFSLKSRLIAFIVALFVLSFGTLSFLLFTESRTVIRSYIESSALEKMEEYGSYVDMVQMQIYDVASLVFNSDTAKNWDNAIGDPLLPEGEKMLANLAMSRFLTQATNSYTSISDVSIYRRSGLRIGGENQVETDPAFCGNHGTRTSSRPETAGCQRIRTSMNASGITAIPSSAC